MFMQHQSAYVIEYQLSCTKHYQKDSKLIKELAACLFCLRVYFCHMPV